MKIVTTTGQIFAHSEFSFTKGIATGIKSSQILDFDNKANDN